MESFPVPNAESDRLEEIADRFTAGSRFAINGLWGSSAAMIVAEIVRRRASPIVAVTPDEQDAAAFNDDLEFFLQREVALYPAFDPRTIGRTEARLAYSERLAILRRIQSPEAPPAVVIPASALLHEVPHPDDLARGTLHFARGDSIDPGRMRDVLDRHGFIPAPMVTVPGEFSIRGDIVDIFPFAAGRPVRLELFDDEVESIREIDLETQRSVQLLDSTEIVLPTTAGREKRTAPGAHFPDGMPVFVLEPEKTIIRLQTYGHELEIAPSIRDAAADLIAQRPGCDLLHLPESGRGISYAVLSVQERSTVGRQASPALPDIEKTLDEYAARCGRVRILCQAEAEAERLTTVLEDHCIDTKDRVRVVRGRISEGFQFPDFGICLINHHELFRRLPVRRPRPRVSTLAREIESFHDLKPGDMVIHLVHGMARYDGLTRMERENGGEEDFLILIFRNDVALYLPASKAHLVHRYVGGTESSLKPDRLGGQGWIRRRQKVEKALHDLAADLLDTQAVREQERGFAFTPDEAMQTQFDASFPYEDTDDQATAVASIKKDMELKKTMDRLLCGDVGFGKTELAIRAAFKAVLSGKQVAVLVPTTILAEQHYETFRTRLADYPVSVEVLSRFRKRKSQKSIIAEVSEGKIDILIGTHRILSRDVAFSDLGLLVIDEEQRFGVVHKERLKRMKKTVDVLTMTATPIPRTLHMALVGIRDISSLETPPEGRMPIDTRVEVYTDETVRKAILFEISRGGQVFFVHNRVETIDSVAERMRALVPSARIESAHGRMKEGSLQKIVSRFMNREIDVLVCTTIIESGIDMPAVNTIIIDRADMFGLADLHQLRGRVGRGNVRAYCCLLIPHRHIADLSLRRLKAIEELSYLGAGFDIALKDLEIRGAGNVLGMEQHGHIMAVGYDLYCRLLKKTVLKMKGAPPDQIRADDTREVDLDIRARAFLPPAFIPDDGLRMSVLRRLASCRSDEEHRNLQEEMRDRFGRLPEEAARLLDMFRTRRRMMECGIQRIALVAPRARGTREIVIELFDPKLYAEAEPFVREELHFVSGTRAYLVLPKGTGDPDGIIRFLKSRLMARDRGV